jgi:esterase
VSKLDAMELKDFNYHLTQAKNGHDQAPWLIFLHGLMGSSANWRRITPAFEPDFNILTYDQRGHGRSFKPIGSENYKVEDFSDDLNFLMNELKIPKAILIGHSMGGRTALNFTYRYPQKVLKLILEDIGPSPKPATGSVLITRLKKIPVPFETRRDMQNYFVTIFDERKLGAFLATNMAPLKDGKIDWSISLTDMISMIERSRVESRWHEFESLKCPTLVVRGENSNDLSHAEYQQMLSTNSHATGVEIAGAGHWVHGDQPEVFIQKGTRFIFAETT